MIEKPGTLMSAMAKQALQLTTDPPVVYLAGVYYSDIPSIAELYNTLIEYGQEKLIFTREPENQHDLNAIRVSLRDGRKIGYIPKSENAAFAKRMDAGEEVYGRFTGASSLPDKNNCRIVVAVITEDLVFLPPLDSVRSPVIPTKIEDMSEVEQKAIHELSLYLPLLQSLKGTEIDEYTPELHTFKKLLMKWSPLGGDYLKILDELMNYNIHPLEKALSYATYTETKAYLTFFIRQDHFCEGAIESSIEDGTFIPIIERLNRFAGGE